LLVKEVDVSTAMAGDSRRVDDLPKWVLRSWIIPLILGILMLILGLVLLFNVKAGIETLRWLVVFALIFAAVEAFATASLRQRPWVGWLVGFAYVVGAIISIAWPRLTLFALVIIVGASFLVGGIFQAIMAVQVRNAAKGWVWSFVLGLLSVIAGVIFLFWQPHTFYRRAGHSASGLCDHDRRHTRHAVPSRAKSNDGARSNHDRLTAPRA
jgi:uncharacterized membrane protein HdeD (DUF308 family)